MTTFKSIMAGVLSFLLMFSLVIFGITFMLKSTVMNPDFITERVEKANITQLAKDFTDEYLIEEMPEDFRFFEDVVYEVIADHEPWLKEQFSAAVHEGYDYLLEEKDSLEISIPLESLKESVRASLWLHFMEQLPEWITGPDDEGLKKLIYENIYEFVEGIPAGYLPDEYATLSEAELRLYVDAYFEDIEAQITDDRLPPSLEAEIEDLLLPYFNQYYDEIVEDIPAEFVVNEEDISPEAMEALDTSREWIGVYQIVFYALIGFMVLLIAGIVLIHLNVKDSTRSLSKTFIIYGLFEFIGIMVARYVVPNFLPIFDMPVSLQNFITDFYTSVLDPLLWFSVGILIAGVALLLVSIFYRRGRVAEAVD